ncbi:hypothetical protein DFQ27_005706 [Actinomortierella ambigua]|uniref:Actin polymerization protein Bzz1 n=1 Tax=Actinomortierella ambigua TaxID=1343610 RepID=A0A9P6U2J5_9FUNG|nr:hypothetical protein DFQ27_005706 [Actinomortierella ambigua]
MQDQNQGSHPSFGADLKDQIPLINQLILNGISFTNEFRDFCKERATIERDYAHRIDTLVKKYQLKKEKKQAATQSALGGTPTSPLDWDHDAGTEGATAWRAWAAILNETESMARDRHVYSESLLATVVEPLKNMAAKKEEARKKHVQFAQKLMTERDKSSQERDKAKAKYDTSCEEVDSAKQKQERAYDERNQEKLKRSYYQDILDMNNNKNMQALEESRVEALKAIWESYIGLEKKLTQDANQKLDAMLQNVQSVDASADSAAFIRSQKSAWTTPADLPFESSQVFNDTGELVNDNDAQVFMSNKLMKLRRKLAQAMVDIKSREKDLEGLQNLKDAYTTNRNLGDPDEVHENILEISRSITVTQTMRALYEAEINAIVSTMGDGGVQQQPHDFKAASFTIPTTCDYCQSTIWGLAKQGFTCRDCGYNCHSKCEMKVPPNCSNVKGGAKAQRQSIIIPSSASIASSTMSTTTTTSLPPEYAPVATPISEINTHSGTPSPVTPSFKRDTGSTQSLDRAQAQVIYDYDAASPAEMSVRAGDILTILEGDDGSGWVRCSLDKRSGLVPATYIEIEQFYEAYSESAPEQKVRALYDYDAQSDLELTIREGDVIVLTSTNCSEGWWEGTLHGRTAQFPASYVESI